MGVRGEWVAPLLVGVGVAAAAWVYMLGFADPWTMQLDNLLVMYPMTLEAYRQLAAGRLPEWATGLWGGFPLIADPVTATFYLPHWLAFLLTPAPHVRAFDLATAWHLGWLAAGSVVFTRQLGAGWIPSLVVAVVIGGGRQVQFWAHSFLPCIAALAWWPWLLAATDRIGTAPRAGGSIALGSVALAAQVLAGYPEFALYSATVAGIWVVAGAGTVPRARRVYRFAVLSVGAAALAAPQSLPTASELGDTFRAGAADQANLLRMFISNFGDLVDPLRPSVVWIGLVPLLLSAVAVSDPAGRLLVLVAAVAGLLSLGDATPLMGWMRQVPPYSAFRGPHKFFTITELALLWAATLGASTVWRRSAAGRVLVGLLMVLLVLERGIGFQAADRGAAGTQARERPIAELLATFDEDVVPWMPGGPSADVPPRLFVYALNSAFGNIAMVRGLEQLGGGTTALLAARHRSILGGIVPLPLMDLLGVDLVWLPDPECRQFWGYDVVHRSTRGCLLRTPRPAPRYAFGVSYEAVENVASLEARTLARRSPLDPVPVLATTGVLPATARGPIGQVDIRERRPGQVGLDTVTPRSDLLLVRESWKAGWTARVDGGPVPIHRAAGLWFAVPVPAGAHRIDLEFRQPGLRTGLTIAGAWVVCTLVWWWRGKRMPVDVESA